MKHFKKLNLIAFLCLTIITLTTSCSKEEASNDKNLNEKTSLFLRKFYNNSFKFGKSSNSVIPRKVNEQSRTTELENVIITEVFVGNEERARGYLVTDKESNDMVYFIDVDRINYKLTTFDVEINETQLYNDINEFEKYLSTDELDYIKVSEEVIEQGLTEKGPFIGWGKPELSSECVNGRRYWIQYYYVGWIKTNRTRPVKGLDAEPLWAPCE